MQIFNFNNWAVQLKVWEEKRMCIWAKNPLEFLKRALLHKSKICGEIWFTDVFSNDDSNRLESEVSSDLFSWEKAEALRVYLFNLMQVLDVYRLMCLHFDSKEDSKQSV